jgi:coenzyme F420-reducing hydrogenase beta subunit
MHKVKIGAKNEYEWLNNFKVLQTAFDRNRIDKVRVTAIRLRIRMVNLIERLLITTSEHTSRRSRQVSAFRRG